MTDIYLSNDQEIFQEKTPEWILGRVSVVLDTCIELKEGNEPFTLNIVNRARTQFVSRHNGVLALNPNCVFVFKQVKYPLRRNSRSLLIYLFLLEKIRDLLHSGGSMTKRDLYYQNVGLFKTQNCCDDAIEDIAVSLGVRRSELGLVASSKGLVIGPLKLIMKDDSVIDATTNAVLIPDNDQIKSFQVQANQVLVVEKDATFQALIQSSFLIQNPTCIIVTGKGFPDIATRALVVELTRLAAHHHDLISNTLQSTPSSHYIVQNSHYSTIDEEFRDFHESFWDDDEYSAHSTKNDAARSRTTQSQLYNADYDIPNNSAELVPDSTNSLLSPDSQPVSLHDSYEFLVPEETADGQEKEHAPEEEEKIKSFLLTDCDPDGVEIFLTYKIGSKALQFYSQELSCPSLEWLGMKPDHIFGATKLSIPEPVMLIPLSVRDRKKILQILEREETVSRHLRRLLQIQLLSGYKAELQVVTVDKLIEDVINPGLQGI